LKNKLFIVGCVGIPACYGGFETFAENIALELSSIFDVSVLCSTQYYPTKNRENTWKSIKRIFITPRPNGFWSLFYDLEGLLLAAKDSEYILLLGAGSGLFLSFIRSLKSRHLLVHVDGLEWKRAKWNVFTRYFLRMSYKACLHQAKTIILDNVALHKYVPVKYSKKVVLVNYGGNHLPQLSDCISPVDYSYALVIARAEPENNLHRILKVFRDNKNLKIILISNWVNTRYGKKLYNSFSHIAGITMIDAIYDSPLLLQQYRMNCSVYIHGHSAGGTNPSLVEAMYTGVPIIAWDNEFNRNTTNNLALYFGSERELAQHLKYLNHADCLEQAKKLQNFAKQNYTWNIAAQRFLTSIGVIKSD